MDKVKPLSDLRIAKKLISKASQANSRGIVFDLSFKEMKKVLTAKKCYITGVKLNAIDNDPHKLTIDRIDNDKGYIDGNVIACSSEMNSLKNNLTVKQIEQMYLALVKHGDIIKDK
jgi:hypothetical protein